MAIITKCFCFFLFFVMVVSEAGNLRYHTTPCLAQSTGEASGTAGGFDDPFLSPVD